MVMRLYDVSQESFIYHSGAYLPMGVVFHVGGRDLNSRTAPRGSSPDKGEGSTREEADDLCSSMLVFGVGGAGCVCVVQF